MNDFFLRALIIGCCAVIVFLVLFAWPKKRAEAEQEVPTVVDEIPESRGRIVSGESPEPAQKLPVRKTKARSREALLACIREIESGGDYQAVSPSGTYSGAYQFDQSTWESVGGTGDPAQTSRAEQDKRASILLDERGLSPWPTPAKRCA